MPVDGICEIALQTTDLTAMERFYCDFMDCRVLFRDHDRVWVACGERGRIGFWLPGRKDFADEGGVHVHFALSASPSGLDALRERLTRAGIEHQGPVVHEGGDRSLYVRDPAGNVVEVWDFFRR
jgi:catechol-2,3-dioxygenase